MFELSLIDVFSPLEEYMNPSLKSFPRHILRGRIVHLTRLDSTVSLDIQIPTQKRRILPFYADHLSWTGHVKEPPPEPIRFSMHKLLPNAVETDDASNNNPTAPIIKLHRGAADADVLAMPYFCSLPPFFSFSEPQVRVAVWRWNKARLTS